MTETLLMLFRHGAYSWGYCQTARVKLVGELLEYPLTADDIMNDIKIPLEQKDFHKLYYGILTGLRYEDGSIQIVWFENDPDEQFVPISDTLLYRIAMLWHDVLINRKQSPYIRLDIDWDNDTATLQELDSWGGPLQITNYNQKAAH